MFQLILSPLAVTLLLILGSCGGKSKYPEVKAVAENPVERGLYLVTVLACNECHTPMRMGTKGPEPDFSRMLSGHPQQIRMPNPPKMGKGPWLWTGSATNTAFAGPWGISYSSNLTPDETTGLGIWTEEMFVQALKTGRHMGLSRPIMPPMPWRWYSQLPEADLRAIFTYLRSIQPITNQVPDHEESSTNY